MTARDHHLLAYVCRCLGLPRWFPQIESAAAFRACETLLERLYLMALLYRAEEHCLDATGRYLPTRCYGEEIWILDAWLAFAGQIGPGTLAVRPQSRDGRCTRDLVIDYDAEPAVIVEVDGYAAHRGRRQLDQVRDLHAPLPTIRLYEETEPPLQWPRRLLGADWDNPCNHCGLAIYGKHSCPPF